MPIREECETGLSVDSGGHGQRDRAEGGQGEKQRPDESQPCSVADPGNRKSAHHDGGCRGNQCHQAAAELAMRELTAEGEGDIDPGIPRITSLYAVELYGWVWFEGTVEDDDSPSNVTVYFSGVYGDFSVTVEPDGSFWSTPFTAFGGDVYAYAEDFDLNRSETVSILA